MPWINHLSELDCTIWLEAIRSKWKVQGAIPVIPFWIGLLVVHCKVWVYYKAGPIIRNSPGKPKEGQNKGEKKPHHHHHRGLQFLLTFILRDFREPSRKACPPDKEREREKKQSIINFLRIRIPEPQKNLTPILNKREQELQENLHQETVDLNKKRL